MSLVIDVLNNHGKEVRGGVFAELAANDPCLCEVYVPSGKDCGNGLTRYTCALNGCVMDVLFSAGDSKKLKEIGEDFVRLYSHALFYSALSVRDYWRAAQVDVVGYSRWCELCRSYGVKMVPDNVLIRSTNNCMVINNSIRAINQYNNLRVEAAASKGGIGVYVSDTLNTVSVFTKVVPVDDEVLNMCAKIYDIKTREEYMVCVEYELHHGRYALYIRVAKSGSTYKVINVST